jgi:Na+/glutamate symporter
LATFSLQVIFYLIINVFLMIRSLFQDYIARVIFVNGPLFQYKIALVTLIATGHALSEIFQVDRWPFGGSILPKKKS